MTEKEALLQKIKALADRGESGERENAAALLEKLMNKYGISEEELDRERVRDYFFPYKQETERRLLLQIIYAVTGKAAAATVGTYTGRKRKKLAVECTAAESIEIEAFFSFYRAAFEKELETFYSAFYMKNGIYPPPDKSAGQDYEELTAEERERYMKAAQMQIGMERHEFRKQLSAGTI